VNLVLAFIFLILFDYVPGVYQIGEV